MDIRKMNIWRGGVFKQIKYIFATPQQAVIAFHISESELTKEIAPLRDEGIRLADEEIKLLWKNDQRRRYDLFVDGEPTGESVLILTNRSSTPFYPYPLPTKKGVKEPSLKEAARIRHAEARFDALKQSDTRTKLQESIITGSFIVIGLYGVVALIIKLQG